MEGGKFDIPEIPDIPGLDDDEAEPGGAAGGGGGGGARRRRGLGGGGRGNGGRRGPRRWLWLLIGVAVGVTGTLFLPSLVAPYLPAVLRPDRQEVRGLVLEKSRESDPDRLLLTVESERGSMLATFRNQVAELDLLVSEGDSVTLSLGEYRPFVDDPSVRGVRRNPGSAPRETTATDSAARARDTSGSEADTGAGGPAQADTATRRDSSGSGAAGPGRETAAEPTSAEGG